MQTHYVAPAFIDRGSLVVRTLGPIATTVEVLQNAGVTSDPTGQSSIDIPCCPHTEGY